MRIRPLSIVRYLTLFSGFLPILIYGWLVLRAPSKSPIEASTLMSQPDTDYILVDVRKAEDYKNFHFISTTSWPIEDLLNLKSTSDVPTPFSGRPMLLLSENGILSSIGTLKLRSLGMNNVFNIRGGIQSWIAETSASIEFETTVPYATGGFTKAFPHVELPIAKQIVLVLSLYLIKPMYTILSFALIYILWKESSLQLKALRWSLIFFTFGEMVCWINFQFLSVESILLEYLHSFSMVLTIAFLTFALVEVLDRNFLKFSDPKSRCALLGTCRGCIKVSDVPCVLTRLFQLSTLSLIVLAFMPFQAVPTAVSYNTTIFGFFRNLMHPVTIQLFEIRYSPVMAILFLLIAFFFLVRGKTEDTQWVKIFLSAGVGFLTFSFLRLAFIAFYRDDIVWFVFWEEATELLLMGGITYLVWAFKDNLNLRLLI